MIDREFVASIQAAVSGGISVYKSGLGFNTVEKSHSAVELLKAVPQIILIAHSVLTQIDEGKSIELPNGDQFPVKTRTWATRLWSRNVNGEWERVELPKFEP